MKIKGPLSWNRFSSCKNWPLLWWSKPWASDEGRWHWILVLSGCSEKGLPFDCGTRLFIGCKYIKLVPSPAPLLTICSLWLYPLVGGGTEWDILSQEGLPMVEWHFCSATEMLLRTMFSCKESIDDSFPSVVSFIFEIMRRWQGSLLHADFKGLIYFWWLTCGLPPEQWSDGNLN